MSSNWKERFSKNFSKKSQKILKRSILQQLDDSNLSGNCFQTFNSDSLSVGQNHYSASININCDSSTNKKQQEKFSQGLVQVCITSQEIMFCVEKTFSRGKYSNQ